MQILQPLRRPAAALALLLLLLTALPAGAQDICRGDINGDGVVTSADAAAFLPLLFVDLLTLDIETLLRADVNDDGNLSGADIAAILSLDGLPCPTPPPSPTVTPTPTVTRTPPGTPTPTMTGAVTATPTLTRLPTSTPTPACDVHQVSLGSTAGTLSPSDCQQLFLGRNRLADVYTVVAAPGTVMNVDVTTVAPLVGYVQVVDAGGQFQIVTGPPPIRFTVTTSQPYQIVVTSDPNTPVQQGNYTLTLTSNPCPTPVALTIGSARAFTLDGTECPEPAVPSVGTQSDPADVYTFAVTNVPTNLTITMQQVSVSDSIAPAMALLGPDGYEAVSADEDVDCTAASGTLACAQIRFLALQPGTYTILSSSAGGLGRYSLTLTSPVCTSKVLDNIPPDRPLGCGGTGSNCSGTLDGNTTHTPCAAPLPDPANIEDGPAPGSPAALYSFTANAGDVISVRMTSDDSPHLYLLGPAPGNALITSDDSADEAEMAATLPMPGTYTIVAANDNALQPDDPPINYTLLVQKCPVRGGLNPLTGRQVSGAYSTLECLGSGDIPYRSYAFTGVAGQFVTTTMTSSDVDAFIRVYAPDGSVVENDDDLFQLMTTTDARASRILPVDGTYFVEVSASPDAVVNIDALPPPAFTLQARLCATTSAVSGQLTGTWEDADCDLGGGSRGDVFTFPAGGTPSVATVSPPANGCVVALLGDGTQVPSDGCSAFPIDFPVLGNKVLGFIVAGEDTSTRGAYAVGFSRCPITTVGFGETRHGVLNGANCADPDGIRADWYLLQGPAGLVNFNSGMTGQIIAGFAVGASISDQASGGAVLGGFFSEDSDQMLSAGDNLAAVLRVAGVTPTDRGAYALAVDAASARQ